MNMKTDNKMARVAGALYLLYIVIHVFGDVIGRSRVIVFGDAAATAQNIVAAAGQFRIGFMSDLLAALLFLLAAWALYRVLKPVNKNIALLFLLLNLVGVAIQCFSDLFLIAGHLLLSDAGYVQLFPESQLQAFVMLFLDLHRNGLMMAQLFYGAWLLPLGYLVFKSGSLPKILGIVLMIHCATWLMTFLQYFLLPDLSAITYLSYPLGFIAEFGLGLWLLIKGVASR
jgi:hypothetical protein